MKKVILTVMVLSGIALTSCKKDRECSCQVQTKVKDAQGNQLSDNIVKTKYTFVETNRLTAHRACVHTQYEYQSGSNTTSVDSNCTLE
ncbi:MAG: hypothetical protein KF900_04545 [Bacteroidetes bacterium]|nr:hypothetical protein [Bacteroidota bacterium]